MDIWVLPSATLAPLGPKLERSLAARGIEASVTVSAFGELERQALEPGSAYRQAAPSITVIVADAHDLFRQVFEQPLSSEASARADALVHARAQLDAVIAAAAATSAHVLVANASYPPQSALRLLETDPALSLSQLCRAHDDNLRELVRAHAGAAMFDYGGLVLELGYQNFHDARLWAHARMRVSGAGIDALAQRLSRHIAALVLPPRKCLVVDLDGTLWGGVLGEDGVSGIAVGGDGVGVAYRAFQRDVLELRAQGVLLAIASHNEQSDAFEAIERHPGMVLRREHFSAWRIDWQDKPSQLRAIADELNIGVDSLVFADNSPHEREAVRTVLPDVCVLELPADPADYVDCLRSCGELDTRQLSAEDRARGEMMAAEKRRAALRASAGSFQSYLDSLELEAVVAPVDDASVGRAAQLCARTNQLNLTLRRHDEAAIRAALDGGAVGVTLRASDRLGDGGIVGFAMLGPESDGACEIDTLVMSCRALGRGLEATFLSVLANAAAQRGAARLVASYVAGPRNQPCAQMLSDSPFRCEDEAAQRYVWDLHAEPLAPPAHVRLRGEI